MFLSTVKGNPVHIRTPAHWNLIGRNITTVLACVRILPTSSSNYAFIIGRRNSDGVYYFLYSKIFLSLKLRNFRLAIGAVSVSVFRCRPTFNICLPR